MCAFGDVPSASDFPLRESHQSASGTPRTPRETGCRQMRKPRGGADAQGTIQHLSVPRFVAANHYSAAAPNPTAVTRQNLQSVALHACTSMPREADESTKPAHPARHGGTWERRNGRQSLPGKRKGRTDARQCELRDCHGSWNRLVTNRTHRIPCRRAFSADGNDKSHEVRGRNPDSLW